MNIRIYNNVISLLAILDIHNDGDEGHYEVLDYTGTLPIIPKFAYGRADGPAVIFRNNEVWRKKGTIYRANDLPAGIWGN